MPLRWILRGLACFALFSVACAGSAAPPERTFKPNEIQVIEPPGQQDKWTFGPSVRKVARGTTVTIVNRGKEFHTVTSDDPGRLFDISIDANQTASLTFDKLGTFTYHCGVHPQMTGTIQVCDGACG